MSIGLGVTQVERSAGESLNATADVLVFSVVKPVNVQRFGFIVDNGTASGTTVVVSLDKRVTAGSDTGRVELMTLNPDATVSQGEGVYKDADDRYEVNPGEELVVEVKTAAGVASTANVFIEYVPLPFVGSRVDGNMTEVV